MAERLCEKMVGNKYGRLKVLEYVGKGRVLCECDCGAIKIVQAVHLRNGMTKSCGCYRLDFPNRKTHGESNRETGKRTKLYHIWCNLKSRCNNPNDKRYADYGGRGISVCEDWRNSYVNFRDWANKNGYCDGLTIDRIDNNGNYEPSNCRWSDWKAQSNNKRNNHLLTYKGETKTMAQWADKFGINFGTLKRRIYRGWSTERAIETPIRRW